MQPVQRQSKGRTRRRRAHDKLRGTQVVTCPNCGSPREPHRACRECGYVRPGLKLDLDES